jgi:tryptophan synthase alpha chain
MSRLKSTFEALKKRGEPAIIPYLTAGFPTPDHTLELLLALDRGGADVIEIGVPFSDPIADGPTIQRASKEALDAGTTVERILGILSQFREASRTPVVLFGAYNPFFHFGIERFAEAAATAGADALLIPDIPVEEADEVKPALEKAGLDLILLVAPTTPADRKTLVCSKASGFIYYISVRGVTGARQSMQFQLEEPLAELRAVTSLPIAVGFGIATAGQAAEVGKLADGVVVGSALIDLISQHRGDPDLPIRVENFIRELKAAVTER